MRRFSPRNLIKVPGRKSYHDMILEEAGLVSYWNFGAGGGSKLWDQKGVNYGTISGATWTPQANGRNTLDFDGMNDLVNCGNAANVQITGQITLEAWVLGKGTTFGGHAICKGRLGHSTGDYNLMLTSSGTNSIFSLYVDGLGSPNGYKEVVADVAIDRWVYFVGTYDGDWMRAYIDGQLIDSMQIGSVTIDTSGRDLWIGSNDRGSSQGWFDGFINEIAIYNVTLTPATILQHYQVGVWKGLAA